VLQDLAAKAKPAEADDSQLVNSEEAGERKGLGRKEAPSAHSRAESKRTDPHDDDGDVEMSGSDDEASVAEDEDLLPANGADSISSDDDSVDGVEHEDNRAQSEAEEVEDGDTEMSVESTRTVDVSMDASDADEAVAMSDVDSE